MLHSSAPAPRASRRARALFVAAALGLVGTLAYATRDRLIELVPPEWLIKDLECPAGAPAGADDLAAPLSQAGRACVSAAAFAAVEAVYVRPAQLKAIGWGALAARARREALAAPDDAAFYARLKQQFELLGDRHTALYTPAEAVRQVAAVKAHHAEPTLGAAFRPADRGLLVADVLPGPVGEAAGLRRGQVVETVNGRHCPADCIWSWPRTVVLGLDTAQGKRRVRITQAPYRGAFRATGWRLAGTPGGAYVRIPNFVSPGMARSFEAVVERLLSAEETPLDWLVIDVRSNGGGLREQLVPVLGTLLPDGSYGVHRSPDGEVRPFQVVEQDLAPRLRDVAIVVLVDAGTKSAAELFAAILKAEQRALIIGEPTTGETEGVEVYDLPGGARISVSAREFFLRRHSRPLSATGIVPDIIPARRWYDHSSPGDPDLSATLELMAATDSSPSIDIPARAPAPLRAPSRGRSTDHQVSG